MGERQTSGPTCRTCYVEKINGNKYQTADGEQRLLTRVEQIKVRTNPLKTDTTQELLAVESTRNGPIVVEADGRKYALKWTALDPKNNEFEAFYQLNRAKDWKTFQDALKLYGGATQNFVFADVKGKYRLVCRRGRIPIRKVGRRRVSVRRNNA
jgi:penicillin amidase